MTRTHAVIRGALPLLLGAAALAGCTSDATVVGVPTTTNPSIFSSYVALGNSITAGYQSGGINDSTQRQSYAVLLAKAMGTRFAYPSLVMPGCPPPINNLLTGGRVGGAASTSTTCFLRNPASVTAVINNVAVPGIATADPDSVVGPNENTLTQLFLGGKTMVAKALDAHPTFATVWIGNNDILEPALSGFPGLATPVPVFISNYAKDINALVAGAPGLKGVLIGVVQVAAAPLLFPAALIQQSPAVGIAVDQIAGRHVFLDPNSCSGNGIGSLVNFQYIVAIRSRPISQPGIVFCQKVAGGGANDPGDNGILDSGEQATVAATVTAYNAYIKAKADSIGFAFYDPNTTLLTLKQSGAIPPFPDLTSATAPFGQYFTFDGVHPSAAAHVLLANDLITVINAKYGTTLAKVQ